MARTSIPVQRMSGYGGSDTEITWTAADAANDHEFTITGKEILLIKNDDASGKTVSIIGVASDRTFNQAASYDVVVAAGKIGSTRPERTAFAQAGGVCHVDITADTSLSFAVVGWTDIPNA